MPSLRLLLKQLAPGRLALLLFVSIAFVAGCGKDLDNKQIEEISAGKTELYFPGSPSGLDTLLEQPKVAKRVKHVHFMDKSFSGREYARLKELPNLQEVTLYSTSGTDAIAPVLSELTPLKRLTIAETDLTDSGLQQLRTPQLTDLGVSSYGDQISDAEVERWKASHPNCRVDVVRE